MLALAPKFSALAAIVFAVCAEAVTIGPSSGLSIINSNIAPDGFNRATVLAVPDPMTLVNQPTFPGPLIKAFKGDHFKLNVVDRLTNHTMFKSTSIHWHGIYQRHTVWADGPTFVTQCPIISGHSFEYDFSVPDQAGTFWYHSHFHTQYCDGLRGPLVIYERPDPRASLYDVDDDTTVITLSDWYHTAAANIGIGSPDSTLINGKGRWSVNPTAALAVISVTHGKRYRLRVISMSCDPNYIFSIEGHSFTIIETDAVDVQPVPANSLQIFAGQRYSVVLNANQPVDNYWIRAQPDHGVDTSFNNGINSAILRYVGAPNQDPGAKSPGPGAALNEANLHPLTSPAAPGGAALGQADVVIPLQLSFDFNKIQFLINNVTFTPPSVPVLLQILSGKQSAQDLLPSGAVYTLPKNKIIEIVLMGGDAPGGPHPFHLHGNDFSVVQDRGATPNFANPVRRDVIPVAAGLNTTIRFKTDNPGPWFLHCHIDFHLEFGLAVVMAVDTRETKFANPVPPQWSALCPAFDALDPSQT